MVLGFEFLFKRHVRPFGSFVLCSRYLGQNNKYMGGKSETANWSRDKFIHGLKKEDI